MKKIIVSSVLFFCLMAVHAQSGHEIKINLQHCNDTIAYLAYYQFDKLYISDTCKKVVNGNIVFKGKKNLDKGVYFLLSQGKGNYFDFIIDEQSQKQQINSDKSNLLENLKAVNSKQNENFFNYIRFVTAKNKEFDSFKKSIKGQKKSDSTVLLSKEYKVLNEAIMENDLNTISQNKGNYLSEIINLKTDKVARISPRQLTEDQIAFLSINITKSIFGMESIFKMIPCCEIHFLPIKSSNILIPLWCSTPIRFV